jgi:hypothetical protein
MPMWHRPPSAISSIPVAAPTSIFGSFLGADASPRLVQLHGTFTF